MGQAKTTIARASLCAFALLLCLLFSSTAQADPPFHVRAKALDITGLNKACGVAVDSKGDVYASSAGEGKIKVYDPSHKLLTEIENANEPCGLAVDSKGNLYVLEKDTGNVALYAPNAYPFSGTPTYEGPTTINGSGEAEGISVDRTDDRLYVAEGERVEVYGNEVQQLFPRNVTGGSFKLSFEGEKTASIKFDATAAEVKAALEALPSIGTGAVAVTGKYVIAFGGTLAYANPPQIEAISSLTGDEKQEVKVSATAGTYKLRFEGEETAAIAFDATAATLQAALEALAGIVPGDISVVGGPGGTKPYIVTFAGAYAGKNVGEMRSEQSALTGTALITTISQAQTVTINASAGTYALTLNTAAGKGKITSGSKSVTGVSANFGAFRVGDAITGDGIASGTTVAAVGAGTLELSIAATKTAEVALRASETTAPIPYNATAAELKAALEALADPAPGDVSVTGGPGGPGGATPYVVSFAGAYATRNVEAMGSAQGALTGTASVVALTGGASVDAFTTSSGGLGTGERQQLVLVADDGSYKLSFEGEETAAIAFNASAAQLKSALEALAKIAPGDVSVTGPSSINGAYTVDFEGAFAAKDVPQLAIVSSLAGNEVQQVTVNATAGSYKLSFEGGEETAAIAFDATVGQVKAALEALAKIAPGDVSVNGGPGNAVGTNPYQVTFEGAYAAKEVIEMSSNSSELTGSASVSTVARGASAAAFTTAAGASGNVGEGQLTEATGVAAYTYIAASSESNLFRHHYLAVADAATDEVKVFAAKEGSPLKLRRTITGVDHDEDPETPEQEFGFGAEGAQLAADPGNESRAATHQCAQVQVEGEDQACTQGHFFLYDAANEAVDEFDATGEFVDQIANGAFADAEPTALAVERSGMASDGTLYASAGSGPVAKILAFRPLKMPTREALPALSRTLTKALAVATDCEGHVYVGAESRIRVYDPAGKELTSFEDEAGPRDLATDCEGNVYVLEGNDNTERNLVYYSPSAYPPTAETTYIRSEALVEAKALAAVAVNPANGHAFVLGNLSLLFPPVVAEFGAPSEGSKEIGTCEGIDFTGASTVDIDVYAATGELYVTATGGALSTTSCGAEPELLVYLIEGGGCPSGEIGSRSTIAIDQSNGHIVQWANNQPGAPTAREYDSSGSCVAEYGKFSTASNNRIAIDNSCALHDPPLTEQTTPKCSSLYPSNGNVYVAADGANNEVQPYDVSAFGPLDYGEAPPEEGEIPDPPIVVTGAADGFGAGGATLHGTVNPRGALLEECTFQYLTLAEYEENGKTFAGSEEVECAESPAQIGEATKAVAVHADLGGLEADTAYSFRLVAANAGGGTAGGAEFFGPPVIETMEAQPISYDEATLRARIDPFGQATEYRFNYGTEEGAYDQSTPVAELAASKGFVEVKAPLTGLEEGSVYHYRLVASNPVGTATGPEEPDQRLETLVRPAHQECANAEYRTGFSTFLPDCRAYELVTPADLVSTTGGLFALGAFRATANGEEFFNSWFVAPRGPGAGESVAYKAIVPHADTHKFRAERGAGEHPPEGWESEGYGPSFAQAGGSEGMPHGVSADQRYMLHSVLNAEAPSKDSFPSGSYLRVPAGEASRECAPEPKAQFEVSDPEGAFEMVGCGMLGNDPQARGRFVTAGGTHLIFTSKEPLEGSSPPSGTEAIYDRAAGKAATEVVSVKPDGSPFGAGEGIGYIAATEDGEAVVFKTAGQLLVHRDGETTQVAEAPYTYAGISEDGGRVFFMDKVFDGFNQKLPSPAGLFACDVEGGDCAGPEAEQEPVEIATKSNFVNVSADGSHVFFMSRDVLTAAEENEGGEEAKAGEPNLYAWEGGATRFVAILHPQDLESFRSGSDSEQVVEREDLLQWTNAIPHDQEGRAASPTRSTLDGEVFVFQSHAQLTAYDNEGKGEIYRYDPAAALGSQLSCVSCSPSGAPHESGADSLLQTIFQGVTLSVAMIPNLSDDGGRVFFESRDALLPEDANEVTDVYEWRAPGTSGPGGDTCKRPRGCLALISTGQGEAPSFLYGAAADGEDVFFVTQERLVGQDVVGSFSIYDARVLGGIPDPPAAAPCEGDACQGQGSTPPALPVPASTGPGGTDEEARKGQAKKCRKGKHRVKGRCVAKKHRKHRHRRARQRAGSERRADR